MPGAAAVVVWCVAVRWRLARYLVRGHQRSFIGCPCPLAAVILTVLVAEGGYPALAAMAALCMLMVSSVPCRPGRACCRPRWPAGPHVACGPSAGTCCRRCSAGSALPRRRAAAPVLAAAAGVALFFRDPARLPDSRPPGAVYAPTDGKVVLVRDGVPVWWLSDGRYASASSTSAPGPPSTSPRTATRCSSPWATAGRSPSRAGWITTIAEIGVNGLRLAANDPSRKAACGCR